MKEKRLAKMTSVLFAVSILLVLGRAVLMGIADRFYMTESGEVTALVETRLRYVNMAVFCENWAPAVSFLTAVLFAFLVLKWKCRYAWKDVIRNLFISLICVLVSALAYYLIHPSEWMYGNVYAGVRVMMNLILAVLLYTLIFAVKRRKA